MAGFRAPAHATLLERRKDREHTPMVFRAAVDAQLLEDGADVLLDRVLGDDESGGDPLVGSGLRPSASTRSRRPRRPEPEVGRAADAVVGKLDRITDIRMPPAHALA